MSEDVLYFLNPDNAYKVFILFGWILGTFTTSLFYCFATFFDDLKERKQKKKAELLETSKKE